MKNVRTTSLWCATLMAFVALNVACRHHEGAQSSKEGSHKTICQPGETIFISDVAGGKCAVNCEEADVNKGQAAIFQARNSKSAFDVVFALMPKTTHNASCDPGAGKVLQNPHVPVPAGGHPAPSGPTQNKGCYEYTIYPAGNSVACNDPNIVVN